MFGLLKSVPFETPLTFKCTWSSVVCSTCIHVGNQFGTLARFAAGPDTALLAALYEAQTAVGASASVHYCPLRPGVARLWKNEHPGARFAAAISLLAAAARLEDHLRDGDRLPVPRFIARRLARRWVAGAQKSAGALGFDIRPLQEQIADQRRRESHAGQSLTYYAEPTAFCFGEAFAHTARLSGRPENVDPLRQMGRAFGQHVYLFDAVEDLVEDRRQGRFNPLSGDGTPEAAYRVAERWFEQIQRSLEFHMAQVTMPQPEWIRPILGQWLRRIGRQRLHCASACSVCGHRSAKATPLNDRAMAEVEQKRISVTFGLTCCGTVMGFCYGGLIASDSKSRCCDDCCETCCDGCCGACGRNC